MIKHIFLLLKISTIYKKLVKFLSLADVCFFQHEILSLELLKFILEFEYIFVVFSLVVILPEKQILHSLFFFIFDRFQLELSLLKLL